MTKTQAALEKLVTKRTRPAAGPTVPNTLDDPQLEELGARVDAIETAMASLRSRVGEDHRHLHGSVEKRLKSHERGGLQLQREVRGLIAERKQQDVHNDGLLALVERLEQLEFLMEKRVEELTDMQEEINELTSGLTTITTYLMSE